MKNFPHQMNDLFRLTNALQVFAYIESQGKYISDDQVVGIALAKAKVYTFRAKNRTLDRSIELELQKPRSSRGTHTAARSLRRMFLLTGFLQQAEDGTITVSENGHQLLNINTRDQEAEHLLFWGNALRKMALSDSSGNLSHPYRILLRLVEARPGIAKRYLSLALEARDDSNEEFHRLLELIDWQDWDAILEEIGVSEYSAQNAVKILPAIAEQIGDIVREGEACYLGLASTEIAQLTIGEVLDAPITDRHRLPTRRHREVTSQEIASLPTTSLEEPRADERDLAPIEEGIEQRRERTNRHQELVQDFAYLCEEAGFDLYEYPFDCLAIGAQDQSLLIEAKTLSGESADERSQIQRALAQLNYYEYFDLPVTLLVGHETIRLAIFESEISVPHQEFLESHRVKAIWRERHGFTGTTDALALLQNLSIL